MAFDINKHASAVKGFNPAEHADAVKPFSLEAYVEPAEPSLATKALQVLTGKPLRSLFDSPEKDSTPDSIGQRAEDYSARQAELVSPLVPGVPVRQGFVNETRKELLAGGELEKQPGVIQTTQQKALEDTKFPKKLDAVAGALEKGQARPEEYTGGDFAQTLKAGTQATGRAVKAFTATVAGDEEKVLQLRKEREEAYQAPELTALLSDLRQRQKQHLEEDAGWFDNAKEVLASMQLNPTGAAHLILEQTPNGLVPLATGAAGFMVGGLPGGVAGLFGGNTILSSGFRALEAQGDTFDAAAQGDVLKKGATEGAVITGVDVIALGISNFVLGTARRAVETATRETLKKHGVTGAPGTSQSLKQALRDPDIINEVRAAQTRAYAAATTLGQRLGRGAGVTALEGLGEGTGAYLGKLAADGEASKMEAILEGISGVVAGGVQNAALAAIQQKETAKLVDLTKLQTKSEREISGDLDSGESQQSSELPDDLPQISDPILELTPTEQLAAQRQQQFLDTGTVDVPSDPSALEDVTGLDEMMLDPLYKQPIEWETAFQEHMKRDMDAGLSEVVARRRALEALPEITPMTARPITWSSVPEQVGLNLSQAKLAPGSVTVIGGFNDQFSPAYTQALGSTVEKWAKKYLNKGDKIILNLSGLKGAAVGGYQQTPSGIHVISPRELVRTELAERFTGSGVTLDITQPGQQGYNTFTQQQTFGGLTHEFGHAVAMSNFESVMPEQFLGIVGKLDSGKIYTDKQLSEMPAPEAAVIRDYQNRKASILRKEMSAEQLIENWIGPWKMGKDLMKSHSRDLYSYAKEVLLRDAKLLGEPRLSSDPLNQVSALELIHAMGRDTQVEQQLNAKGELTTRRITPNAEEILQSNRKSEAYYLQFSEFMAEQFSRYAHMRQIDKGTALGLYFHRALQALRSFFKALKARSGESGDSVIKPGEAFETWVDQLHVSRALGEAQAKRRRENARRFKARLEQGLREARELTPAKLAKAVVQQLSSKEAQVTEGEAVEDLEFLAEDRQAKEELKERIREAIPNIYDRGRQDLMRLVGQGRLMEAEDQLADIISERAKQDKAGGYEDTPDGTAVEKTLARIVPRKEASLWKKAVNFTAGFGYKLVQLQQIAHESTDAGVKAFVLYQNRMQALKNNLLQKGTVVAETWENLSRQQQEQLDKLLMQELYGNAHQTELEQDLGTGRWSHVAGDRYSVFAKGLGIDTTTEKGEALIQLALDFKNSILQHIQVTEATAVEIIRDKYGKAPIVAKQKEVEVRTLAQKWREAPYVPQGRYGNYIVKVFANDSDGNRTLIYRTHFEEAASQDKMVLTLKKKGLDVEYGKISDETALQLALPVEFLSVLGDSGEFTATQLQQIGDAMLSFKGDKAFSRFLRDADKTAGASTDRLRDYANWVEDSANFISKLAFGRKMTKARSITRHNMQQAQALGNVKEARELQRVLDTMTKSQEFIMHPLEEWFKARSFVALTFLMWAPKTALMNLTGLFQTWAAVTADYGDIHGNAVLAKSMKDLIAGNTSYDENWVLDQALKDGLIDQGFGYFMSGLANAGNLARRVRPTILGKASRTFVDMGMWPFKAVETANRRLTLLAVYRAEFAKNKKNGLVPDAAMREAYETASRYTRLLQNDYASGNRPELMRGKKSIMMVFLSYPQYMLWVMSGGFERGTRLAATLKGQTPRSRFGGMTMRMWLIFLSLSGFEGLPFGEAIGDLLQRMWTLFGGTTNLRVEAHRFLKDTAGVEDSYWRTVIQRGFLHDVLGTDLSGSYSLGKPLPGTGLFDIHARNWQEFVGATFAEFAGPFGGVAKAPIALGLDEDITARDVGKVIPGFVGNIAKAVDAAQNGVTDSKKARILKDEQGAYRDPTKAEIALIAGGFRLSDVSRHQRLEHLKREQVDYWMGRRTGLKQQYRTAVRDGDAQLRADVEMEIEAYNKEIPGNSLRLSGKELNQFVRQERRAIHRREQGQYPQKQRAVAADIESVMR